MKKVYILVASLIFLISSQAKAQVAPDSTRNEKIDTTKLVSPVDFEMNQQWELMPFAVYPAIEGVGHIRTNDGTNSFSLEDSERIVIRWVAKKCGTWGDRDRHVLCNGTKMMRVDNYLAPAKYKNGDTAHVNIGSLLFIISNDEKSYVAIRLGHEAFQTHFVRVPSQADPNMDHSQYNAFRDALILGNKPNIDQQTLIQILKSMLPQKPCGEQEEGP